MWITTTLTDSVQAQQSNIENITTTNTALQSHVELLKSELCRKDHNYSWCN